MAVFTVHIPRNARPDSAGAADRVAFIKEGFCWPAFLVAVLWLVYHRMWLILLIYLGVVTAAELALSWLGVTQFWASTALLLAALYFASEANNLRRWHLSRKGYVMAGLTSGEDRDTCERRFFERWRAALATPDRPPAPVPPGPTAPRAGPADAPEPVIGLFPEPGAR